ncbi:MAG: DUF4412 domain-containing protein [Mucilaginibacter sp.]
MKTILKLALCLFVVSGFSKADAQKKISEGTITYTVSFELPADKQQFAAMLPKEITGYFRGDSTATTMQQGPATIKGIQVYKTNYQSMLIDVPVANKKIAVVLTPADIEQIESTNPNLTFANGTETQTIAGYKCKKVTATDGKSGAKYDIWITNDIDIAPNSLSHLVSTLGGVPVKFVTFSQGIKINAEIKEVKETTVPIGFFTATKEYESMSLEDLKAMSGQ